MKIAIATTQMFIGGAEILLRGLAIEMMHAGHDIAVYTRQLHGPLLAGFIKEGITLMDGPPTEISNEFDTVVIWSQADHRNALRKFRGTIINFVGNTKPGYFSQQILNDYRIDGHIVDSENTKEYVITIDPNAKTQIWYFMASPKSLQMKPNYEKYGLSRTQNVVGTLCAHRTVKNVPRLMDAFAKANIPNSIFIVGGQGPATAEWQTYGNKLLGDRCKFVGNVPHETLGEFLGCCDIFLNQYNEGLGGRCLTVSEAAGAGCYIITNENGGAKENILASNGKVINDDVFDVECPKVLSQYYTAIDIHEVKRKEAHEEYRYRYSQQSNIVEWICNVKSSN